MRFNGARRNRSQIPIRASPLRRPPGEPFPSPDSGQPAAEIAAWERFCGGRASPGPRYPSSRGRPLRRPPGEPFPSPDSGQPAAEIAAWERFLCGWGIPVNRCLLRVLPIPIKGSIDPHSDEIATWGPKSCCAITRMVGREREARSRYYVAAIEWASTIGLVAFERLFYNHPGRSHPANRGHPGRSHPANRGHPERSHPANRDRASSLTTLTFLSAIGLHRAYICIIALAILY